MGLENATLNYKFNWVQSDRSIGDTIIIDNGAINLNYLYASGTGVGEVNKVWYGTGQVPSGLESYQVDLFNLSRSVFGGTITTSFSGGTVKSIYIKNLETGDISQSITLSITGSKPFTPPFAEGTAQVHIAPDSVFLLNSKYGWSTDTTKRYLGLDNPGFSPRFEIAILGVTTG